MALLDFASAKIGDLSLFTSYNVTSGTLTVDTNDWRTPDYGVNTGRAFRAQSNATSPAIYGTITLSVAKASFYVRMACRINSVTANEINIVNCYEGATLHTAVTAQPSTGILRGYRSTTSLQATAGNAFLPNKWFVLEVWFNIHDTTGRIQIKVNGVATAVDFTGDTRNAGTAGTVDNIRFGLVSGAPNPCDMYFDDIGVDDAAYLGLGSWMMAAPVSTVAGGGWTASTGTVHEALDEVPPSMTDYIYCDAASTGTTQRVEIANLPSTPTAIGNVVVVALGRTSGAGGGNLKTVAELSGTTVESAAVAMDTTERVVKQILATKPGGGAWDEAGFNALTIGVRVG
jgi:hypothetical protein